MKCPVCNKEGISDYNIKPTVCPQCNTDLKGFSIIEAVQRRNHKKVFFYKMLTVVIGLISLIIIFIIINRTPAPLKYRTSEIEPKHKVQSNSSTDEKDFKYVVKKGDNLSKIAYIFYNDYSKYNLIMLRNNLEITSIIYPNDTLIIRLR